jgi:hypothetical protein
MPRFPEPEWFLALGRLMAAQGELFRRIGYVDTRFIVRVLPDEGSAAGEINVGLAMEGYALADAAALECGRAADFDPDFAICARRSVWNRMLDEIARDGRPELRHTLNSLALMGDELWLESADQLREDKFYRFNQSLQEFFNLAAQVPAD